MSSGMVQFADPAKPLGVEMIEVPVAAEAEPDPAGSDEATAGVPASATAAERPQEASSESHVATVTEQAAVEAAALDTVPEQQPDKRSDDRQATGPPAPQAPVFDTVAAPLQEAPRPVPAPDPALPRVEVAAKPNAPVGTASKHWLRPPQAPLPGSAAPAAAKPHVAAATGSPADDATRSAVTGRIRNAVQSAVKCPAAARMMGQSGRAGVTFDYRNGALSGGPQLLQSSGVPVLDTAALSAVRDARYPDAPPEILDQVLHLLVWVEEACSG